MTPRLVRNISVLTLAAGLATAGLVGQAGAASAATAVSIHANHRTYSAGAKAYISGHVSKGRAVVTVTIAPAGHRKQVIRVQAGPKGHWSARGPVYYNTRFTVAYRSASDSVKVGTHVRIATSLGGSYATSDGYRLVHAGTRPSYAFAVGPNKTGHHVTARLQERIGGSWHTVDTRSYKLRTHSVAELTFHGSAGHKFRIRTEYHADKTNLGHDSRYTYVRFV